MKKKDEFTICDKGCAVVEPYGFVPEDGCPVHDPILTEQIYLKADKIAKSLHQITGEKNNYYITLEQLESILKEIT